MSLPISLFIGLRYLSERRRSRSVSFISAIAMLGIVLGVGLLITVLSVMNGFDRELRERILNILPQVTISSDLGIDNWPELREQLLQDEDVVTVAPFTEIQALINVGKNTKPAFILGVDTELEAASDIAQFLQPTTLPTLKQQANSAVLGAELVKSLGLTLGDTFTIIAPRASSGSSRAPVVTRATLIDIVKTGTELDHSFGLMSLASAAPLSPQIMGISGFHIKVKSLFSAPSVARRLANALPLGYRVSDWTQSHGNIYQAIQMSKSLVGLLLFLIIAIAAFNVVSTMVMVVVDKQSAIAILQTLGLSRGQVMRIFIIQGSIIGVLGTFGGVLLGLFLATYVDEGVALLESLLGVRFLHSDIYPVDFLPSAIQQADVIGVAVVSIVMCFLSTLYPAWKASTIKPAIALRHD